MSEEPTAVGPGPADGGRAGTGVAGSLARFVPILAWAPAYRPAWLTKDLVAGFTIWGCWSPR